VFIDTSVFAGQHYNFSSTALATFMPIAKKLQLKLLLPDPIEREIKRHMAERCEEAVNSLEEARRKSPLLNILMGFPARNMRESVSADIRISLNKGWRQFLAHFDVVKLGYKDIDVSDVMNWYDEIAPPFAEGKKRKEFPDAFAIAILEAHAKMHQEPIAVVSEDQDFKEACIRFPSLLYFPSLPSLTEVLLADTQRVAMLRDAVAADLSLIEKDATDVAELLDFAHADSTYEILKTSVSAVSIKSMNIVTVGNAECTLTFSGELESEHSLRWRAWNDKGEYGMPDEWVINYEPVSGTAKVELDPATLRIKRLSFIELDDTSLAVTAVPFGHD
jgi:hypothetical protein